MRRHTRPTTLEIGTISSGTLRVEDVLPAMLEVLEPLRLSRAERHTVGELSKRWTRYPDSLTTEEWEVELVETLYTIAGDHCPDYCYVGSTEGDGAEIRVWPAWDELAGDGADPGYTGDPRGDGYVAEARNIAGPGHTHALETNDHGNATLYRRAGRRWVECWSIV